MSETWKIIWLSVLAISMWVIGYICGKCEGYDSEIDDLRKCNFSDTGSAVFHVMDMESRRKNK